MRFIVEMAGLEPASERFDPRIPTSVVLFCYSPDNPLRTRMNIQPAAGTRKPLFRTFSGVTYGTSALSRPFYHRPKNGVDGRDLTWRSSSNFRCLMQREAERKVKCGWHLIFCAEFTRSAPLGSQSGTSLLRRSLSSPCLCIIIP